MSLCLAAAATAVVAVAAVAAHEPAPAPPPSGPFLVEPWGRDAVRVRWAVGGGAVQTGLPGALDATAPPGGAAGVLTAGSSGSVTNGNIRVDVLPGGGGVSVTRVDEGASALTATAALARCNRTASGFTSKAVVTFTSAPEQMLFGTGEHMNTHGIPGRLPAENLEQNQMLPRTDMKGGRWDFESCTVYSDSSGAEICVPWVIGATPPVLRDPAKSCAAQQGVDQSGAVPVSDASAEGTHATEDMCCTQCAALQRCDVWVHEPSTNSCWLMRHNGTDPVKTRPRPDRTVGFKAAGGLGPTTAGTYEYGLLWNMPNFGQQVLDDNQTVFSAHDPINNQVDFWVTVRAAGTAGTTEAAASIMNNFVDAVGHAPVLPEWASGYWHSPMGRPTYSQAEAIAAAEGLHSRGIKTDLFIIDYFNWKNMGDYTFNPNYWPDPKAFVDRLAELGMRVMVSAWPFVLKSGARASPAVSDPSKNLTVHYANATPVPWPDSVCESECYLYDATNPDARAFIFDMLKTGYVQYGVKNFWFDASEPESIAGEDHVVDGVRFHNPLGQPDGSTLHLGTNQQVGMMWVHFHTRMVWDGLKAMFPDETPVTLARSGWTGTQQFGASNWNGDLQATWTNLKKTVVAGLNAQLSGLAWWTHDIGAIGGCNIADEQYRELLVRWFQFGLTSPIFRQHGSRPVEPWALLNYSTSGKQAYDAILKIMSVRYKLQPYVMELHRNASATGAPINTPLHWQFPSDPAAWFVTDEFMFGPRFLVAPVTDYGARERPVYFPRPVAAGCANPVWRGYTATTSAAGPFQPGSEAVVPVPFDELAMFELSCS